MSRPSWDDYFMSIATATAARMSCDRARIGAVIVAPDNHILATGYGGAPSGWPSCDEAGHQMVKIGDIESCVRTVHAEHNAVLTCAKHGIKTEGGSLYTTASTCYDCFKMAAQAGIRRIVYAAEYTGGRNQGVDILALAHNVGIAMIKLDGWSIKR